MISSYEQEFYKALQLGGEQGFPSEKYQSIEGALLTTEIMRVIEIAVIDKWGSDISSMAGQCFKVHSGLNPVIESILNIKAYLTFGYIKMNGIYVHKTNITNILEILNSGLVTKKNMSFHSWITLPTMEIIDLTTMASNAVARDKPPKILNIIWGQNEQLEIKYFPQLAGNE